MSLPNLLLSSGSNGEPWWIAAVKAFIVINLVVDLLYSVLDPRVRLAESKG